MRAAGRRPCPDRRGAADFDVDDADDRGAVGLRGVVTVRAVRLPEDLPADLLAAPEARVEPDPDVELRVLVFPAMLTG